VNYALTVYPLSNGFRGRLEGALAAAPVYLNLAEFRKLPLTQVVGRLRSLRGARLVLPLEDENSRLILPALLAVAAASNAAVIEVRHPNLRAERVRRRDLVRSLLAVAGATAAGFRDAAACYRELRQLLRQPLTAARQDDTSRVLYLNANLWFGVKAGGSIGHVAGVANALQRRGFDVAYASAGARAMISPDISSVALPPPDVFGLPPEMNQYRFHTAIARHLQGLERPRFIYQRMSLGNYAGVVASRRWGAPLVLEYNGSEVWIAKHWGRPLHFHTIATHAEDASLRHAHVVVTISEPLREELLERGVPAERIVCYPNCIDPAVFDPARFTAEDARALRGRLGLSPDATLATFIGTFGQWHGVDVLARAIRQLVDRDRAWLKARKLHFLLVGDGLKMPIVREILGDDCGEFVTLTGLIPQAEAPSYLAASDVLLSPHVANHDGSKFFGSPTKLFEYMAMGKAIVASDLDQIGQVLAHSVRLNGEVPPDPAAGESRMAILCPPGDVASLVDAVTFAVERPAWRAALGRNARAEALAKYTWDHHVSSIVDRIDAVTS